MTNIFLYGTLRHPGLLEIVAGRRWQALNPRAARLTGYQAVWVAGHGFPMIEESDGAIADGLLLGGLDGETVERLNYYELGFGYDLLEVAAEAGGETVAAKIYFPQPGLWQPGGLFSLDDWSRDHWPLTRHSASEVMSYFGRLSGADMAARYPMIQTRAMAALAAERDAAPTSLRSAAGRETVALEHEEITHSGFFLMKALELRHPKYGGGMSDRLRREVFIAGDAAIVLPYDPVRDRVMLIEQLRMGPYARGDRNPWVLEPIAGRIDGGESAAEAAIREAREEAGLTLSGLERIGSYYATPGYSTEVFHNFVGIAELPDGIEGQGGLDTEHEDIRSHVIGFGHAMALLETGEINVGPLIVSLLWLARERDRLRAAAGA